jgi:hypothetical protein
MFELIFQSKNEKRKELNLCKNSINFCARSSLQTKFIQYNYFFSRVPVIQFSPISSHC